MKRVLDVADHIFAFTLVMSLQHRFELRHIQIKHPRHQPEHKHVLALVLRRAADGFDGPARNRNAHRPAAFLAGIGLDVVGIVKQNAAGAQRMDVILVGVLIKRD